MKAGNLDRQVSFERKAEEITETGATLETWAPVGLHRGRVGKSLRSSGPWPLVPSSNKSPGLDAVLGLIKEVEREKRQAMEGDLSEGPEKAEVAKLAKSAWKEAAKAALKDGSEPPEHPDTARIEPEPFLPRFAIADGTVERLAVIVSKQPRGTLLARDELAGWLQGMTRYSGGGSDRPFWLEAYGGRAYSVERMGREPVHIDRLSIAVTGGIQPDRLKSLLLRSDDDGLLARFIPIWPDPVPLRRPRAQAGAERCAMALRRLYGLSMYRDETDRERPWVMPFSEPARDMLDAFRLSVRAWEDEATATVGNVGTFAPLPPGKRHARFIEIGGVEFQRTANGLVRT